MEKYKKDFIDFMVESEVLRFGDFTTKSGRQSPFFINTGNYMTGDQLKKLGEFYARAINESFGEDYNVLFGPAYKGIPLAVTTSIALKDIYDSVHIISGVNLVSLLVLLTADENEDIDSLIKRTIEESRQGIQYCNFLEGNYSEDF